MFNNVSFSPTNFFRRYMFKVCRHITIFPRLTKIPEVDRFLSTRRSPRLQQKNIASRDSPKSPGSTDFCSTRHSPRLEQKNAASRRQMLQPSSSRLPNGAAYNRSMYPLSEPGDLSGVHLYIEFNLSFRLISN